MPKQQCWSFHNELQNMEPIFNLISNFIDAGISVISFVSSKRWKEWAFYLSFVRVQSKKEKKNVSSPFYVFGPQNIAETLDHEIICKYFLQNQQHWPGLLEDNSKSPNRISTHLHKPIAANNQFECKQHNFDLH